MTTLPSPWTPRERALWERLCRHRLEDPEAALDLPRRLAREQGWSLAQALEAIEEYRRFCFLACVGADAQAQAPGLALTPSAAVDEVWHLHLCYTRDYWQVYCPQVLEMPLHHGPTRGGREERLRYHAQYAETLARYERYFGSPPPIWWPAASLRFEDPGRILRVDRRRYWLLPKPAIGRSLPVLAAGAGLALLAGQAMALSANPLDWGAGPFLTLYAALLVLATVSGIGLRWFLRDRGAASAGPASALEMAWLAGGSERCVDAAIAQMLGAQQLRWDVQDRSLKLAVAAADLEPPLDEVACCVAADGKPERVIARAKPRLKSIEKRLQQTGLLLDGAGAWRIAWISALPMLLVLSMGAVRLVNGLGRGKPVGFLLVMSCLFGLVVLVLLLRPPRRTRAGDFALAQAKVRHERLLRAPRGTELGIAVALTGTAVLSQTAFADYHQARQPAGSSGDGGGSDGGDDGGGSGCGGCGGGD